MLFMKKKAEEKIDINQIIAELEKTIADRRKGDPKTSYIAKLFKDGEKKISRKVSEEAGEVVIAALAEGDKELISESADLLFHLLVLLGYKKISITKVFAELEKRMGISGLDEKASRIAKEKGK